MKLNETPSEGKAEARPLGFLQISAAGLAELLKDEIKEQANHLMGEHYSVIRVNFSDFIIQY